LARFYDAPMGMGPRKTIRRQPEKQSLFTIGPIVTEHVAARIPGYTAGRPKTGFGRPCAPERYSLAGAARRKDTVWPGLHGRQKAVCRQPEKTVFAHYRAYSDRTCGRPYTRVYGREAKIRVRPDLLAPQLPPPELPQLGNGPFCLCATSRSPSCRPRSCRKQPTVRSVSAPAPRAPAALRSCREQRAVRSVSLKTSRLPSCRPGPAASRPRPLVGGRQAAAPGLPRADPGR
jgi:hypothetical protein